MQAKLGAYELPSPPKRRTPTDELEPISTHSSWARYSSHDRSQRSSASAGEADNIFARDFAEEAAAAAKVVNQAPDDIDPTASLPLSEIALEEKSGQINRKSKSMTFGRSTIAKLRKVYRVGSLEFATRTAFGSYGHRSSISEGRMAEYPELEMLPPLSPVIRDSDLEKVSDFDPPRAELGKKTVQHERKTPMDLSEPAASSNTAETAKRNASGAVEWVGEPSDAKGWSMMYVEDCVTYPTNFTLLKIQRFTK